MATINNLLSNIKQLLYPDRKKGLSVIPLTIILLLIGSLFSWLIAEHTDRDMRANLLQQARLISEAVNIDRLKNLTGTEADLASRDYQVLNEQIDSIRHTNVKCR
jgi:hypothetical protein